MTTAGWEEAGKFFEGGFVVIIIIIKTVTGKHMMAKMFSH